MLIKEESIMLQLHTGSREEVILLEFINKGLFNAIKESLNLSVTVKSFNEDWVYIASNFSFYRLHFYDAMNYNINTMKNSCYALWIDGMSTLSIVDQYIINAIQDSFSKREEYERSFPLMYNHESTIQEMSNCFKQELLNIRNENTKLQKDLKLEIEILRAKIYSLGVQIDQAYELN
jgi:hypothetical protein